MREKEKKNHQEKPKKSKSNQNKAKKESLIKMKLIVVLLVCLFAISAVVVADEANKIEFQTKITCDLLNNPVLCFLHCFGHGYRGGYCSSQGVCTCRN